MNVRYDGPTGNVNRDVGTETGGGDVLENGCVYEVSDELGQALVRYDANWHCAEDDESGEITKLSRPDMDKLAQSLGIESPERFPNKRALAAEIVSAQKVEV